MNRWFWLGSICICAVLLLAVRSYFVLQAAQIASPIQESIPLSAGILPTGESNSQLPPASASDPSVGEHTRISGGRADITQIGPIVASQQQAYTGDDITFTVTIQNNASYKKFVRKLCWESTDGNFGCSPGFNLNAGQVFSISNSGRFESSGDKSVWVTWSQDEENFYSPLHSSSVTVQIL